MSHRYVFDNAILREDDEVRVPCTNIHKGDSVFRCIESVLLIRSQKQCQVLKSVAGDICKAKFQMLSLCDLVHNVHLGFPNGCDLKMTMSGRIAFHQTPVVMILFGFLRDEGCNVIFDNTCNLLTAAHRIIRFAHHDKLVIHRKNGKQVTALYCQFFKPHRKHLKHFRIGKATFGCVIDGAGKQYRFPFFFSISTELGLSLTKISYHETFPHNEVPPLILSW